MQYIIPKDQYGREEVEEILTWLLKNYRIEDHSFTRDPDHVEEKSPKAQKRLSPEEVLAEYARYNSIP
ncbi:MAG: hypothetical protein AAF655_12025 [Bacteroidota bacterium]